MAVSRPPRRQAVHGHYTEKYCSTHATEAEEKEGKKNKYEWDPNSANIPFTSEGGASYLKGAGEIKCEHDTDSGTFEGATRDKDVFRFTDCEVFPFGELSKSYGAEAGEIVTYELCSLLIDHGEKGLSGKEPAAGEVWMQETNTGDHMILCLAPGPSLASFECQGIPFVVTAHSAAWSRSVHRGEAEGGQDTQGRQAGRTDDQGRIHRKGWRTGPGEPPS